MLVIVMLSGKAESGKDSYFNIVFKHFEGLDIERYSFGDEVKHIAKTIGWDGNKDCRGITFLQSISQCAIVYDKNIWTNKFVKYINQHPNTNDMHNNKFIVVTDCRYESQIDFVKNSYDKVYLIRINRPSHSSGLTSDQLTHQSETDLDYYTKWDYVINNDNDIEQYKDNVITVMNEIVITYQKRS